MITTSFREIRKSGVMAKEYRKLAKELGGIREYGRDTPIALLKILDIFGFIRAIYVLGSACKLSEEYKKKVHCLMCDYAGHVLDIFEKKHPEDNRPREAIDIKRRWINGDAGGEELESARAAAQKLGWSIDGIEDGSVAGATAAAASPYTGSVSAVSGLAWVAAEAASEEEFKEEARVAELAWQELKLRNMLV